ncbi:MAG TPA: hypothetical protein VLE99_02335 [Candidatus Saccharimonadales bacterium]|nr:hypothetical protein [Candidatus Saccharimonadales bacterium]
MGKVLAGKPIYGPENDVPVQPTGAPTQSMAPAVPGLPKEVPEIELGRVENQVQGERLEIFVDVTNHSHVPIFLDTITLLGASRKLDSQLQQGERRQFLLYSGPILHTMPSGYADVQYRKATDGDYFKESFQMRCEQTGYDFHIAEFHQNGGVQDI